ncbi:Non-specific serine/threonine protein kinase [Aphelenchoides fujianensis]|nr:Non-specific serine/threonine protein kinase [Aphelenchoides fujianensis]
MSRPPAVVPAEFKRPEAWFTAFCEFFKLDEPISRHLLYVIARKHTDPSKLTIRGKMDEKMAVLRDVLASFGHWRTFLFYLGTYNKEIPSLSGLRSIAGWALIALGFVVREQLLKGTFRLLDLRNLQLCEVVHKILSYASIQHACTNPKRFVNVYGDEIFARICGMLLLYPESSLEFVVSYFKAIAISLEANLVQEKEGQEPAPIQAEKICVKPDALYTTFIKANKGLIIPRLMFHSETAPLGKQVYAEFGRRLGLNKKALLLSELPAIVDFYLSRPWPLTLDVMLGRRTGIPLKSLIRRAKLPTVMAALFNVANEEEEAKALIAQITRVGREEPRTYFKKRILGVLLHAHDQTTNGRSMVLRKSDIAVALTRLFEDFEAEFLNTYAAKIFQTLWSMSSEDENFTECWLTLFRKVDVSVLVRHGHKLLFYITQSAAFEELRDGFLLALQRQELPAAGVVELKAVARFVFDEELDEQNAGALNIEVIKKALFESPHLCYDLLPAAFRLLGAYESLEERVQLLDSFLPLVGHLKGVEEMAVLGSWLGHIGAISPAFVSDHTSRPQISAFNDGDLPIESILDGSKFVNAFIGKLLRWFHDSDSRALSDTIGFCLQCVWAEFERLSTQIRGGLDPELRARMAPFSSTKYAQKSKPPTAESQLVRDHTEWMAAWYRKLTPYITQRPFNLLHCLTLAYTPENSFIYAHFLPFVLLSTMAEVIEERRKMLIDKEALALFSHLDGRVDTRESCSHSPSPDGFPLSVQAAMLCSNHYTALYLLERYAVKREPTSGMAVFDRELFGLVQTLFYRLNDAENAQGAYLHLVHHVYPRPEEALMNAEISGEPAADPSNHAHWEAVCSRLLQAEGALDLTNQTIGLDRTRLLAEDPEGFSLLATCAMEAGRWDVIDEPRWIEQTRSLSDWRPFDEQVQTAASPALSFDAHLAFTLAHCRRANFEAAREYFDLAAVCAARSLFKSKADGGRPYSLGFAHLQKLHSLADVQMALPQLLVRPVDPPPSRVEEHDRHVAHTRRDLEPVLKVRRNVLRSLHAPVEEVNGALGELLVQSCQLARNDGQPELALSFVKEAQKNGVRSLDIELQQAFCFADSTKESERVLAVPMISNTLSQFFPACMDSLQVYVKRDSPSARCKLPPPGFEEIGKEEDCEKFLEAALDFIAIGRRQWKSCVGEVMKMFDGLERMRASSEKFFYRYATFIDSSLNLHTEDSVRLLIRLTVEALKAGRTYAHEMMPRMITCWLDTPINAFELAIDECMPAVGTTEPSELILQAFEVLPRKLFFKAFSLLVARLAKFSKDKGRRKDYEAIKKILAHLIVEFPHQAILLSIAEYRSCYTDNGYRSEAMRGVYKAAIATDPKIEEIVEAYKFLAKRLMKLAKQEKPAKSRILDLRVSFADLLRFFEPGCSTGCFPPPAKKPRGSADPLPPPIPLLFAYLKEPFTEITADVITIQRIERKVHVMDTKEVPKRLDLRGSDGSLHSILCKPHDDLGKDACFMDLANMMNARLPTSKYTRNADLRIRTFGVLPLQEQGGLIEWVHGMSTLGDCLRSVGSTSPPELSEAAKKLEFTHTRKKSERKIEKALEYFRECCKHSELAMSKYLRSRSSDPAAYYRLQRRFTTSTALMCAVGFVVGLGDRHTGNILLDVKTGEVMHVDFALLFNAGERLSIPETVPFRLTRNIVEGFGAVGIEGRFRSTMEAAMKFLRAEKAAILISLKSYLNDPLLKWSTNNDSGPIVTKRKMEFVVDRLNGCIHSNKVPKSGPFATRELVAKLIETATDERLLCQMFIGWGAFV